MGSLSFASQVAPQEGSVFSYCLPSQPDATGSLIFGSDALSSKLQFTSLASNYAGHYYVGLDSISVGGQQLPIPHGTFDIQNDGSGGFVFDSGTPFTHLYAAAYNPLVQAVQAAVSYPTTPKGGTDHLCYDVSDVSNPTFPEVRFAFSGGASMTLAKENVFGALFEDQDTQCLLMAQTNEQNEEPAIFGSIQQQNGHIVYDVQGQRIGWSHPMDCCSA